MQLEPFRSHAAHGIIQHLTRRIGVFDLVPCQREEKRDWISGKIKW